MIAEPVPVASAVGAFLLAFPALFSIVNPLGSALIFSNVTRRKTVAERHDIARRIGFNAAIVLLASLWLGSYVLSFFGVSLSALRIGGGLVVAVRAWQLLMRPEPDEEHASVPVERPHHDEDTTFFPLTIPLTTGPGTIAVAIALSSQRPSGAASPIGFFAGVSLAAVCVAAGVWFCYRWSDSVTSFLGDAGALVTSRLVAFLLLCVGVQIIVTGILNLDHLMQAGHL